MNQTEDQNFARTITNSASGSTTLGGTMYFDDAMKYEHSDDHFIEGRSIIGIERDRILEAVEKLFGSGPADILREELESNDAAQEVVDAIASDFQSTRVHDFFRTDPTGPR